MALGKVWTGFGLALGAMLAAPSPLAAADMPGYMDVIVAGDAPAPAEPASQNILTLNTEMFQLYDSSGRILKKNILAQHPVILALFNGAGDRFILYKPGAAPVDASSVPSVYQLLKSVGHATMVISVVASPRRDKAADQSWRAPYVAFRVRLRPLSTVSIRPGSARIGAATCATSWRSTSPSSTTA